MQKYIFVCFCTPLISKKHQKKVRFLFGFFNFANIFDENLNAMNVKKSQDPSITHTNLLKSIPTIDYHLTIENHAKRYKKMFDSLDHIIKNDLPKIDSQYAESYMVEMVYNEITILNASRNCISPAKPFFDYPKLGLHVGSSHIGIHEENNGKTKDRIAIIRFSNNY